MRHYLRRKDTLDSYSARFVLPRGFYSEQFLHAALFKRATAHIHRDWMFCKMGRVSMNRTKQSAIDWWRSMLTQTARRIRSARTGYAFCCASASCACGAYQRRRAACPKAARLLYYTHSVRVPASAVPHVPRLPWHHRWRYSRNAWPECSMRWVGRVECEHLLCHWCSRGCSCYSASCTVSRLGGTKVCFNSTGRTWKKGVAQHVVGKQLFAD